MTKFVHAGQVPRPAISPLPVSHQVCGQGEGGPATGVLSVDGGPHFQQELHRVHLPPRNSVHQGGGAWEEGGGAFRIIESESKSESGSTVNLNQNQESESKVESESKSE